MNTLKIVVNSKLYEDIAAGRRISEELDRNSYWKFRLYAPNGKKRPFEFIEFINIKDHRSRRMITEFDGISLKKTKYYLRIGRIIKSS